MLRRHRAYGAVYIDDIIIFLTTLDEHVQHLTAVMAELRKEKLFAKLKKCSFAQKSLEFCGFIVSEAHA